MGRQRAQQVPPHSCPASHFLGARLGQGVDGMNPMASELLGGAQPARKDWLLLGTLTPRPERQEEPGSFCLPGLLLLLCPAQDAKRPLYYSPNSHNNTMGRV